MTIKEIERAIQLLETGSEIPNVPHTLEQVNEACKIALEALQHEKERIEREKGCEYCKGFYLANASGREFYKAFQHTSDYWTTLDNVTVGIVHDKDGYFLHFEDESGGRMFDVKISSCPICGRKLGESE